MDNLLDNEPVKRVSEFIKKFDPELKVLVLDTLQEVQLQKMHAPETKNQE